MTSSKRRARLEGPSVRLRKIRKRELSIMRKWLQDPRAQFFLNPEKPMILEAGSQTFSL